MSEKYPGSIQDDSIMDAINLDGEHYPGQTVKEQASVFDPNKWTEEIAQAREQAARILEQQ